MITREDIWTRFRQQLGWEFNCAPDTFDQKENTITCSVLDERRRKFSDKPFFLQMVTLGLSTVISADNELHPWLHKWADGKDGIWLFEQHNFYELECELRKHGYKMSLTHHMFLPKAELMNIKTNLNIRWLEQDDIMKFYGKGVFPNAICDRFRPERPDVLAVVALDGEKIIGMAGCSADVADLWQIGIDVLPEYRGHGVACTLVTLLRDEAFRRGAIPYYGTSLSNLASWKTALSSGFEPAWVQTEAREDKDTAFAK